MTISFHKVAGDSHLHLHFGHLVDALIQSDDKYNKTKIDHVDYDPIIKPNWLIVVKVTLVTEIINESILYTNPLQAALDVCHVLEGQHTCAR